MQIMKGSKKMESEQVLDAMAYIAEHFKTIESR